MISEGTHIKYDGKAYSPWHEKNVSLDGIYVALDGIDTTERGSYLPVVPLKAYERGAWFGGDEYLICDGYLEFIRVVTTAPCDDPRSPCETNTPCQFGRTAA